MASDPLLRLAGGVRRLLRGAEQPLPPDDPREVEEHVSARLYGERSGNVERLAPPLRPAEATGARPDHPPAEATGARPDHPPAEATEPAVTDPSRLRPAA